MEYGLPLLTDSQFAHSQITNLIEFNIFDIFDFAKKKYDNLQRALTQNHVISPQLQDNIILELLDFSTSRNDLLTIQRTLAPFDSTEQCSISCAFAQISDLFDIPHVEFYSTIDKWPSAYRGKLLAVLLALSVVPKNSKVRINTDSLNVITQFEKLKKSRFSQTSREYFKANNNFLWAILCRIILTLNLHVEMFKVVAHGDDMGLEKFFNLNRNSKYRTLEVDWTSTFNCLNCDINNNETSVFSSKTKAQKVHLLIEKIPTIEQMKKSLLDLYDGWMCPICGLHDETFNHVWMCSGHYDTIKSIRDKIINHLLTWILEYNDNIQDFNALMALDIWDISYDPNVFTFIDLIKGIIPMSLSDLLSSWTTKKNVVDVLIQLRQFIFNEIFEEC
ncbi:ribonuclease H-like domain-containing protein [Rhizophagus irregularis DAOM 181602=DAOM 197198]|nr:ribonuclease H-like domain-containing protein [Rhizophagus irregularis DAOM 181602=DAOM 197198]